MPFRDRGYSRTNSRQGIKHPSLRNPDVLDERVAGAPKTPRHHGTAKDYQRIPDPPPDWFGPRTEWIVFYVLTRLKGFVMGWGRDFLYQSAVPAPGLFTGKQFERADFLILPGGKGGDAAYGFSPKGILINPISSFTHPSAAKDRIERAILAGQGYREIFITDIDLNARPVQVIDLALRGIDVSGR